MINSKNVGFTVLLFWIFGMCGACASVSLDQDKTYSKNNLTVSFPRLIKISDPNPEEYSGGLDQYQIDHPVALSTEQVHNHLLSLWYQSIDPPGNPRPVFSQEEAAALSPLFKAALNKVGPSQYIQFKYESPGGVTEGEVFGSVESVHWRLTRIRDIYFMKTFLGAGRATWKLVRTTRKQRFHREKTSLGDLPQENWMVVDRDVPLVKPRAPSTAAGPSRSHSESRPPAPSRNPSGSPDSGLQQKLQTLKQLLDQGLIDGKDYRIKKEELLNQHL